MRKIAADRNYIRLKQADLWDAIETGKEMLEDPKAYAKRNISAWIKANAAEIATEATKGLPMGGYIGQFSGQVVAARADEISKCIVDIALGS